MYNKMPLIWFKPIEDYKPDPEEYSCPIYKTSVRAGMLSTTGQSTNFIVAVEL
jgi:dynein heavy chain